MPIVKLTVQAGPHGRMNCPVSVVVDAPKGTSSATLSLGQKNVPCQARSVRGGLEVSFVVDNLGAGKSAEYKLNVGGKTKDAGKGVSLTKGRGKIDVSIRGRHFTTYNYGKELARPNLYPVIGPYGDPVTRRLATPAGDYIACVSSQHSAGQPRSQTQAVFFVQPHACQEQPVRQGV